MKINFITPKLGYYDKKNLKEEKETNNQNITTNPNSQLENKFNDFLAFQARVDKSLVRFYEVNENHMPQTIKTYIDSLGEKIITPLEAQKQAFKNLNIANTIEEVKKLFPEEDLFKGLIEPNQTKATRGILQSLKENEEILALSEQGILKDNTNLSIYLLRKIFLEGKTIPEINNDLDNDLNEDFKADFKFKNKDSKYIYSSTLKALGIKLPDTEYLQSLRYTRDGYSDLVGENISKGQREFWDSLSENERTARAKISVGKFEKWWSSLSRKQIIEMIAEQTSTLDMLKAYKKNERTIEKNKQLAPAKTEEAQNQNNTQKIKTKVGSNKLSQDELFIKWATNNLKIFEEGLSEAEKDTLYVRRMQHMTHRWAEMSPSERTEYISKMKSGSEPLRYTMIDAWNNSISLIKDLSEHLKRNQIFRPSDVLFSNTEFSEFQSRIMSEFWQKHPNYTASLGEKILKSQEKINDAISHGTFEALKKEIMRDKNQRVKELESLKKQNDKANKNETYQEIPEYIKEFKDAYFNGIIKNRLKHLPKTYLEDFIEVISTSIPKEQITAWTKNLKGEELTFEDNENLKKLSSTEPKSGAEINRAIEAAIATILYDCTRDPRVFLMSHSDVKTALYKLDIGQNPIELGSLKLERDFIIPVEKKHIDDIKLEKLYKTYKEKINPLDLEDIIDNYFSLPKVSSIGEKYVQQTLEAKYQELADYLETYGKSILILFSNKSLYPISVKKAFYEKVKANAPSSLNLFFKSCIFEKNTSFELENNLKNIAYQYTSKYPFLPTMYANAYQDEMIKSLRKSDESVQEEIKHFKENFCTKRKSSNENSQIAVIPKMSMSVENKLKMLVIEQAMADILYDATENPEVYALGFEDLCDNIELFGLVKKFPTTERNYYAQTLGKNISITAKRKLNIGSINRLADEYRQEIQQWLHESMTENKNLTLEDLVFILNPDENKSNLDKFVEQRIKKYNLNLKD